MLKDCTINLLMTLFEITLQARLDQKNIFRIYYLALYQDLFDNWVVKTAFGRVGTPGRQLFYVTKQKQEAIKEIRNSLFRRLSAPKRIGARYHCLELTDPTNLLKQDSSLK